MFSVIFDMDGTLLDTQRICIDAFDYAGEKQGVYGTGECVKYLCGMVAADWTAWLKNRFPQLDTERFVPDMRQYVAENLEVKYKEGARELLEYLKGRGVKMAIASGSSRSTIRHHLESVGGLEYFDAIVGSTDVKRGKPHPEVFLLAAEKIGADPSDCYVFGDSPNDMRAGHAAGMRCVGVPDIAEFSPDIIALMHRHLSSLCEAVAMLEEDYPL